MKKIQIYQFFIPVVALITVLPQYLYDPTLQDRVHILLHAPSLFGLFVAYMAVVPHIAANLIYTIRLIIKKGEWLEQLIVTLALLQCYIPLISVLTSFPQ